jgi:hypothetical protein
MFKEAITNWGEGVTSTAKRLNLTRNRYCTEHTLWGLGFNARLIESPYDGSVVLYYDTVAQGTYPNVSSAVQAAMSARTGF